MSRRSVVAIGAPPMSLGFALTGIPVIEALPDGEGAAQLAALLAGDDAGIVLADERLIDALPLESRPDRSHRAIPVLVPVPVARWTAEPRAEAAFILDLLQRAIGYRVRLQ